MLNCSTSWASLGIHKGDNKFTRDPWLRLSTSIVDSAQNQSEIFCTGKSIESSRDLFT
jgi:hypothetical protein